MGFHERDIEKVSDVLESSDLAEFDHEREQELVLEHLEGMVKDDGSTEPLVHARLAENYLRQCQVYRDVDPEVAAFSLEKVGHHVGMLDPARLSSYENEQMALRLAGALETRHMGDSVVAFANEAVGSLRDEVVVYDNQVAARNFEGSISTFGVVEGERSLGTYCLNNAILMSGLASAYGDDPPHREELNDFRNPDGQERWEQFLIERQQRSSDDLREYLSLRP